MEWIKKNKNYIILFLSILFLYKSVQSCNRGTTIDIREKKHKNEIKMLIAKNDSILKKQEFIIDSLKNEIINRNMLLKDLSNELKIAGVKATEAQKRADAVQRTAEKIKANTTIEIINKNDSIK